MEHAFHRVRERVDGKHHRQKEFYDSKCHGKPLQPGDLVWLHSNAVPRGKSKKLHHPWTGPWWTVKRVSDAVYRLQGLSGCCWKRVIVHFDWLKPCHPDTHRSTDSHFATQSSPSESRPSMPMQSRVGTHLEIHANDPIPPQRNPLRSRQPPDRYAVVISHWTMGRSFTKKGAV